MDEPTSQPGPATPPQPGGGEIPPPVTPDSPTVGWAAPTPGPVPAGPGTTGGWQSSGLVATGPSASDPSVSGPSPDGPAQVAWVPSSVPKPGRSPVVLIAFLVLLGIGAVFGVLVFVGASLSPYDKAVIQASRRLVNDPAFKSKFGDLNGDAAFDSGVTLVKDGINRVDAATQLVMLQSTSRILALADPPLCAGLSLGTSQPTDVITVVKKLDEASLTAYLEASTTTALASVHGDPKGATPTDAEQETAGKAWQTAVGQDAFAEAVSILQSSGSHTPTEICTANRKLTDAALVLAEPSRSVIVRLIYKGN